MNTESTENVKKYKPSDNQLAFVEAYLSQEARETIESLCDKSGVKAASYYEWIKDQEFNKWFYDTIRINRFRLVPRILDNVFTRAMSEKATKSDWELALRILDVYNPADKGTDNNDDNDSTYEEIMKIIKEKSAELSALNVNAPGIQISEKVEEFK